MTDQTSPKGNFNEAAQREKDCQALEEATGMVWEPYYQNPSKGAEQDIIFYRVSLTGNGQIIEYDKALDVTRAAIDDGVIADNGSMDFSLMGIGFGECRDQGHIASAITIKQETVRNSYFMTKIKSSQKLKKAFAELKAVPETPGVRKLFEEYESRAIEFDPMLDGVKAAISASHRTTGFPVVKGFTHS